MKAALVFRVLALVVAGVCARCRRRRLVGTARFGSRVRCTLSRPVDCRQQYLRVGQHVDGPWSDGLYQGGVWLAALRAAWWYLNTSE